MDGVDEIAVGWVPYRGIMHRIVTTLPTLLRGRTARAKARRGGRYLSIVKEQLRCRHLLRQMFSVETIPRVRYVDHHTTHMACAYFMSPFDQAALLSIDGTGEYQTCVLGTCTDGRFREIQSIKFPQSLRHLYSVFTSFLGFRPNSGEGKIMALAAYGKPSYVGAINSVVRFDGAARALCCDRRYIDYHS